MINVIKSWMAGRRHRPEPLPDDTSEWIKQLRPERRPNGFDKWYEPRK